MPQFNHGREFEAFMDLLKQHPNYLLLLPEVGATYDTIARFAVMNPFRLSTEQYYQLVSYSCRSLVRSCCSRMRPEHQIKVPHALRDLMNSTAYLNHQHRLAREVYPHISPKRKAMKPGLAKCSRAA